MEELLHYVWKHKLFPLAPLTTTDGKSVEVVDVGLHNRHAGPDFFNAKVRIDGTLWVGNVEIHDKASDWFVHGHDRDARYDNVVLHVVDIADVVVRTSQAPRPRRWCSTCPTASEATIRNCLLQRTIRPAMPSSPRSRD